MSPKLLLISIASLIILLNASIFGTLYFAGIIGQPSEEELAALKAEQDAAAEAAKYAHLEPLEGFTSKSKAGYIRSMGEAVDICENRLREKVPSRKSWAVNYIESRHLTNKEIYIIFIDFETVSSATESSKKVKVTCEVSEATKKIENWKLSK